MVKWGSCFCSYFLKCSSFRDLKTSISSYRRHCNDASETSFLRKSSKVRSIGLSITLQMCRLFRCPFNKAACAGWADHAITRCLFDCPANQKLSFCLSSTVIENAFKAIDSTMLGMLIKCSSQSPAPRTKQFRRAWPSYAIRIGSPPSTSVVPVNFFLLNSKYIQLAAIHKTKQRIKKKT